jgi:hypothetical protein
MYIYVAGTRGSYMYETYDRVCAERAQGMNRVSVVYLDGLCSVSVHLHVCASLSWGQNRLVTQVKPKMAARLVHHGGTEYDTTWRRTCL